jgi:hypothetical protein
MRTIEFLAKRLMLGAEKIAICATSSLLAAMISGTLIAGSILPAIAAAQPEGESSRRVYTTQRVNGNRPVLDGNLDDPAWDLVEWSGDFIQRDPTDGAPPTVETRFKVLFDDEALYFAFHCYDDPALVTDMLARRDWFPGDWIEVNIDSYHDLRTAYSFTLSLSGTRGDEYVSEDGSNWDSSWDPIWEGRTRLCDDGWLAETRIPLGQLRFNDAQEQVWGLQVHRRLFREEERSTWQRISKDQTGWVSRFGELRGLRGLHPRQRIELMPYASTRYESFEAEQDNTFRDGDDAALAGGLDGKLGIGNDLTLDFTVNPDFGQVEADPSVVNLTAFETFFSERRPFFIEGASILDQPVAPAVTGGFFTMDRMFYSRRIGRSPHHWPDLGDDEFMDRPTNTTILGAFKLSGTTASGLSVGLLESVTAEESAQISGISTREEIVEPRTNYFVGRLSQDFNAGNTQVGAMVTSVHRGLGDTGIDFLSRQAYAGALDFHHYLNDRDYKLDVRLMGSHLRGSREAIDDLQTSSARYYQRPDNDYVTYDPTRTSLSGQAGSILLQRTSNSRFIGQTGWAWRSPGFELNDLGYLRSADGINQFTWAGYRWRDPVWIFRTVSINGNQWLNWDNGGNFLSAAANTNFNVHFKNNYMVGGGLTYNWDYVSNDRLRGGPSSKWPAELEYNLWVNSDSRRTLFYGCGAYMDQRFDGAGDYREAWFELTVRPSNTLRVSLNPSLSHNRQDMQYIDALEFEGASRYVFGTLDQQTANLVCRLDLCLCPDLTIQYYAMPFVSKGRYRDFKRITDPRAAAYRDRYHAYRGQEIAHDTAEGIFSVDENLDGEGDYRFDDPDFDFREFNSNLVVRWEYTPGSLLYVVWSQGRGNYALEEREFDFARGLRDIFDTHPHNVFLIKVSRWLSL